MITVREETSQDHDAVRQINQRAFAAEGEARIVDNLRANCPDILSLVAESDGQVVGHIFFSPVEIQQDGSVLRGMGLAPMAVLPECQNQQIGSLLVKEGLKRIKQTDCPYIIVLGHEHYYPRFGFETAAKYGLRPQWDGVPDEVFMVLVLDQDSMAGVSGVAMYRDEFSEAM